MRNITFLSVGGTPIALPDVCAPRHALLYGYHLAVRKKVVAITAPAGYGKTTSTLLWLKDSRVKTAWINLDAYNNTPALFYRQICAGVARLLPDNPAVAKILTDEFFSATPVEFTMAMFSALNAAGEHFALVFDDFHLITDESIINSFPLVLGKLPEGFNAFVLSRSAIPDSFLDLEKKGLMGRLTVSELAFSEEEIRKFFVTNGKILSPTDAEYIFGLTAGWPIGVAALIKSGEPLKEQLAENVLGDYIGANIWNKWDDELKDFLLKVSVVDILSVPVCTALTGRDDSFEVLERLCATNTFLSKLSEHTYRLHHLFLDFLRLKLKSSPLDIKLLNMAAAKYYIDCGDYLTARRFAFRSKNADLISFVIHSFVQPQLLSMDEYVSWNKVFNESELTDEICDMYPYLYGNHMGYFYLVGDAAKTEYYLDKIYETLPVVLKKFPQFLETLALEMHLDYRMPLTEQMAMMRHMPQIPIAEKSEIAGISLTMQLPFIHRSARDYSELTDEELYDDVYNIFGAVLRGDCEVAMTGTLSGLLYEQSRLAEALEKAIYSKSLIIDATNPEIAFCIQIHIAAICAAKGDFEAYEAALNELEQFIAQRNILQIMPNFKAFAVRHRLRKNDCAAAAGWLSNYFVTEMKAAEFYKIYRHFTTVRAHIVLGGFETALPSAEKLRILAEAFNRPLDTAEAWMLISVIYWKTGNRNKAFEAIETSLAILEPGRFIRVVADEGEWVLPMLSTLKKAAEKERYRGKVGSKFLHEVYLAAHEQAKRVSATLPIIAEPVKLSKQQRLVLKLLSEGYVNADMIKITGLTLATIRSHTQEAYKRLGADNAADAVLAAKLLGIFN